MSKITLFHGSDQVLQSPMHGQGKTYNDYGQGLYCTEHIELAKEWACTSNSSGYANKYELDMTGLKVLNLSSDNYNILHWLALLVENRGIRANTPIMRRGVEWLKKNYLIDISDYDVIIGYRADDAYFSFARAFIDNGISLSQLSYAMRLGKLGEQYVLKSEKAFKQLKFISYEIADKKIYYPLRQKRDEEARASFFSELEKDDIDGIYIRDLVRNGVTKDETRL